MKLSNAADIAQLVVAVGTVIGVIAALLANRSTLREVQRDRILRQTPFLAFERGGWELALSIGQFGLAIPGIGPAVVAEMFPHISATASTIRLDEPDFYGQLKNLGVGPALDITVEWGLEKIYIGTEQFRIDQQKASEPLYSSELNTTPTMPTLLAPGEVAQLPRLPTFIVMDVDRKITEAYGTLKIAYTDILGNLHLTQQDFRFKTEYQDKPPHLYATFSDIQSKGTR